MSNSDFIVCFCLSSKTKFKYLIIFCVKSKTGHRYYLPGGLHKRPTKRLITKLIKENQGRLFTAAQTIPLTTIFFESICENENNMKHELIELLGPTYIILRYFKL